VPPQQVNAVVWRQDSDWTVANDHDCPFKENAMFGRISFVVITLVMVTSWCHLHGADCSDDPVERALTIYCEKHKLAPGKLEPYELDLVPGTKVFRYELPAVPGKEPAMSLGVRFAFVFVDSKTGRLFEVKITSRESPHAFHAPLFEEMKKADRKVKTEKEATTVLRNLMVLDGYLWSVEAKPNRAKAIEAGGQYRGRPNTFSGGNYKWMSGDDVGLEVDEEGYVTKLLGGHIR
jgi:hypothetical protein